VSADALPDQGEWRRTHVEGCFAAFVDKECNCPPARLYVPLDAVVAALRARPLGDPVYELPIRADEWAANFIEREFGPASDDQRDGGS
jgi:hypothetical protein